MSVGKKGAFSTRCIHAGFMPDATAGAATMPIYATSTYIQDGPGENKGYFYAREQNPTRFAFERAMAELEEGTHGFAFASGLAAANAVLDLLPAGAHVIASDDLYGGTYKLFERVRKTTSGLSFSYVDMSKPENVLNAFRPETKMVWVETPTNPLLKLADIAVIADLAHKKGALTVVDNTFATPWMQQPLTLGADVVFHSATKYIGGHSDIIAGVAVTKNNALAEQMKLVQAMTGGILSPFDSFLALRGLKTLDLRMERHCANAEKIAAHLQKHPKIDKVYYPGLATHPQHALAQKQMRKFGGIVSVAVRADIQGIKKMLSSLRVITLAVSLGGVESLISHPALMSHTSVPKATRDAIGITDGLLRISVGIEGVDDLIADLDAALSVL